MHVHQTLPQDVGKLVGVGVTAHIEGSDAEVESRVLRVVAAAIAVRNTRSEDHHRLMFSSHLQSAQITFTVWLLASGACFLTYPSIWIIMVC